MLYFSLTKKILITVFCALLGLLALPNFVELDKEVPLLPKNTLNLGLDLRGGSYLLLEVDTETIKKEKGEFLLDDIRSALRKNRIKYSNLKLINDIYKNKNIFFGMKSRLVKQKILLIQLIKEDQTFF